MRFFNKNRGFSLVELLGVLSIIALLASVVIFSIQDGKKKARDVQRVSDIDQLNIAFRLYVDTNGGDIDCPDGIKIDGQSTFNSATDILKPTGTENCNDGQKILDFIDSHLSFIPHDPRGPGSTDYYYYFDETHACMTDSSGDSPLLFAVNLEYRDSNVLDVCNFHAGNDGGMTDTTVFGGTFTPNKPYVKVLNFIQ